MRAWLSVIVAYGLVATAAHAQSSQRVTVAAAGEVEHPGAIVFEGKPRLSDVVKAAQVGRNAYPVGAAWLRRSAQAEQTRLKTGLVYELGLIGHKAVADRRESLATLAQQMRDWIGQMPVTGRKVVRTLEPHALQVSAPDNFPVADGDRLIYPSRPQWVTVAGAVQQPCHLPHTGLADARQYLAQCAASSFANQDVVYVIEPDGEVFEQGVALWNRSPPMAVAPGTVLYVPLGARAIAHAVDEKFNRDMADFLATQPVGGLGTEP